MTEILSGIGVSPGWAAGPVYRIALPPRLPAHEPVVRDVIAEDGRAIAALRFVADQLAAMAVTAAPDAAAVLEAESRTAIDLLLVNAVRQRVSLRRPAAWAVSEGIAEQQALLTALGGHPAERAACLTDIRDRAVAWLLGLPVPGVPDPGEPFVLIADDLAPADTARLDPALVLALVTRRGGPTSHTAILARTLGVPAVVGCPDVLDLVDGTTVSVDGTAGDVRRVSTVERAVVRASHGLPAPVTGPGRTADGRQVPLLLNIGSAADVPEGFCEGVGLYRTEMLFLGREHPPSLEEQERSYAEVFAKLPGRRVVLRTLDATTDMPLPFLAPHPNPALGLRGLRVARSRPEVLDEQLRAVARAAQATKAEVWVMAPMVTTAAEAEAFTARVRSAGLRSAGAVVEVPAAALQAGRLLEAVDFLSIGTNDLSQYTLAADRMNGDLADLLDPWQPALLQLVAHCAEAGRRARKPVAVCGEAAADPLLARVFVGLGITSLSMSAASVPVVHAALAETTTAQCKRLARAVLRAPDARSARAVAAA